MLRVFHIGVLSFPGAPHLSFPGAPVQSFWRMESVVYLKHSFALKASPCVLQTYNSFTIGSSILNLGLLYTQACLLDPACGYFWCWIDSHLSKSTTAHCWRERETSPKFSGATKCDRCSLVRADGRIMNHRGTCSYSNTTCFWWGHGELDSVLSTGSSPWKILAGFRDCICVFFSFWLPNLLLEQWASGAWRPNGIAVHPNAQRRDVLRAGLYLRYRHLIRTGPLVFRASQAPSVHQKKATSGFCEH